LLTEVSYEKIMEESVLRTRLNQLLYLFIMATGVALILPVDTAFSAVGQAAESVVFTSQMGIVMGVLVLAIVLFINCAASFVLFCKESSSRASL
jgi:hypothetical protein